MHKNLTVFLDTNILLHFKPLSQIDWSGSFDSKTITLMICMPVLDELDGKKSDSRLGDRARRAIKDIREFRGSKKPLRPGVTLEIYTEDLGINLANKDEQILRLVKKFINDHPAFEVCVASEDIGMQVRADVVNVPVRELDDVYRLENPGDEKDRKYKQAIHDLATLRNRLPTLSICAVPLGEASTMKESYQEGGPTI
jgi:predicted ribonuclease YlaK